ncbi:2OG-Fe(II) oxygenase [Pseudomonadota bacterium AL_CKDN230030165-1A_HGKHYDSX7]
MNKPRHDSAGPSRALLSVITQSLSARGHAVWPDAFCPEECEALAADAAMQTSPRRVALPASWMSRIDAVRRELAPLAAQWRPARSDRHRDVDADTDECAAECATSCQAAADTGPTLSAPDVWLTCTNASTDCPLVSSGDDEAGFGLLFVVLLNRAGVDFSGGELVLAEQRPRMQTRPHVVALAQGGLAVIAAAGRPVQGARGPYRVRVRHGVAHVRTGRRVALMAGWPLSRDAV